MNPRENPYADNFASSKLLFNTTNAFEYSTGMNTSLQIFFQIGILKDFATFTGKHLC